MLIHELKLFLEVAEAGSLTKVAVQRQTVQSHISRQISELEKTCGAPLFRRTGRGVALTEFGLHVQVRARKWLNDSEELMSDIRSAATVPMGEVRVGIIPSAGHPLMSQVFGRLQTEHPRIRLNIREGQGSELDALLDMGSVDLAVLFRYRPPSGSDEVLLGVADTYLVSAPGSARFGKNGLEFQMLRDLPLVLPRPPSHWRSVLDQTARSMGFALNARLEADSLRLQKEAVACTPDLHALLGPFAIGDDIKTGRLVAAKIRRPELKRYVTLAHPKQGKINPATKTVAALIQSLASEWCGADACNALDL
jgi:LysR family transcriptional regulator, nitrogen assimilation regulatory protein